VLTGGKLTGTYFLYLLFVTTHLRQDKKISILSSSVVNPGHVFSRRGLLEDSPISCCRGCNPSCDESRPRTQDE
jgi:hypothetical protein